jgi:hypothetical protein
MQNELNYEITEKGIGLSEWEFVVLCNVCSVHNLICFERKETALGEEEIVQTVMGLVKRGVVINQDDSFRLGTDAAPIFKGIQNRKFTMMIRSEENEAPDSCFYFGEGDNYILAQPGAREGEYVVLKQLPKNMLGTYLEQSGFIPRASVPEDIVDIMKSLEGEKGVGEELSITAPDQVKNERFMAEFYSGSQDERVTSLYVLRDKGSELLVEFSDSVQYADL